MSFQRCRQSRLLFPKSFYGAIKVLCIHAGNHRHFWGDARTHCSSTISANVCSRCFWYSVHPFVSDRNGHCLEKGSLKPALFSAVRTLRNSHQWEPVKMTCLFADDHWVGMREVQKGVLGEGVIGSRCWECLRKRCAQLLAHSLYTSKACEFLFIFL